MRPDQSPAPGTFCISLDFELMWGSKESWTADGYGRNVFGARRAIPRMLDEFASAGVHATWATVGFLFAELKDELLAYLPEQRPSYRDGALSSYRYLSDVGKNESADPFHFGASLIRAVTEAPGQELATHTFSHFYALEDGATLTEFGADLAAAKRIAAARKVELRSIVFPRNQYGAAHLAICSAEGLRAFRGNQANWAYRPLPGVKARGLTRRISRMVDTYVALAANSGLPTRNGSGLWNVPASQFLRPYSSALAALDSLKLARIVSAMRSAALAGEVFHLWWHPHNFGRDTDENIAFLHRILDAYARLKEQFGMQAMNMAEIADHQASLSTSGDARQRVVA